MAEVAPPLPAPPVAPHLLRRRWLPLRRLLRLPLPQLRETCTTAAALIRDVAAAVGIAAGPSTARVAPGERKFPPPHRVEEPPAESHTFEILPGESLAKYRNAPSSQTDIVDSPQRAEEARNKAVETTILDKMSEEDDDSAAINSPIVQAYEMSEDATPALAVDASEPEAPVAVEESPAPSAIGAVLADAAIEFAPGALQSIIASGPTESPRDETPETPANVPAVSPNELPESGESQSPVPAAATAEPEPVPASSASPSFVAEVAASYSVEGIAAPSSGEPEPKETVETSAAGSAPESVAEEAAPVLTSSATATASPEAADAESPSERAESNGSEEGFDSEEEISEEFEELGEGAEDELVLEGGLAPEGELTAEGAAGPAVEGEANAPGTARAGESGTQAPGAPGDRTYTLREPNQRPRFAPRRRRGRRGPGGPGGGSWSAPF